MKTKKFLQKLEKKKIISRKPKPLVGFILLFISLTLYFLIKKLEIKGFLLILSKTTVVLSFLFAVLHFFIVKTLEK
ncbi:MAG: hypothetical protein KatS3mg001_469 [Candidatus Pacearchaeota archaeon]|nr:MAG: hypothetical protein KatS3mg001_469 [Candidatus Pacearchaeota archaeon]